MIIKIATFFLIGMAVLAMFGRLRWPGGARRRRDLPKPTTCARCGQINLTGGRCPTCDERRG